MKILGTPNFLKFFKELKEEGKIKSDDIENELPRYKKLSKTKLWYVIIKEFKNILTDLNTILKEIEKIKIIRELEIEEVKELGKAKS